MKPEEIFWSPPPIFKGETIFILASGPSLTRECIDWVKGNRCIVVNSTIIYAPWVDVFYFTDSGVFLRYRELIEAWPGLVVTMSKRAKRTLPEKIKRVKGQWMPGFPAHNSPVIRQGISSGHSAISLGVSLGAARIVLLGFDMRLSDKREHNHDEYANVSRKISPYAEFIRGFSGWYADGLRAGVEIVNATPGSAVREFPFVTLDDELNRPVPWASASPRCEAPPP